MKVAILRPSEYLDETRKLFSSAGFEVIAVPFLRIKKLPFHPDDFHFDFAIVTSQTAARIISGKREMLERLKRATVISIGPSTAKFLESKGIKSLFPTKFDSKTLYNEFKDRMKGMRVAIFRSNRGDPILNKLAEVADLKIYILYKIDYEHGEEQKRFLLKLKDLDFIVFSSRMMVRSFFQLAREMDILAEVRRDLEKVKVIAIGPPTRDELNKFGIQAVTSEDYTFKGVLELTRSIAETER
jgi:uroporphyrinogen-III synthase